MNYPLTILTPEGPVFDGEAEALSVTAYHGSLGVMANHAPMISAVVEGVGSVTRDGVKTWYALGEGTLEVRPPRALLLIDYAVEAGSAEEAKLVVAEREEDD